MRGAPAPASATGPTPPLHPVMRGLGSPDPTPPPAAQALATIAPPRQMTPPSPPPRRRFTRKQKTEAVMRLLQGEDRDWVAISLGISPALLGRWQDAFLDGGSAALAQPAKARDAGESSVEDLKDKLHALIKTVEHLSSQMAQTPAALALPPPETPREKAARPALALPPPKKTPRRKKTP